MAQTGSMIAFIVLVVIVVIGVVLYAYLTVISQAKESRSAIDQPGGNSSSEYRSAANFSEFSNFVSQNQAAEWIMPLAEINEAKDQLETWLNSHDAASGLAEEVNANLVAECVQCRLRIAGEDFSTLSGEVCSTPNCGSTLYALRWLADNAEAEGLPAEGEDRERLREPSKSSKSSY
jgi:hypothetical protein